GAGRAATFQESRSRRPRRGGGSGRRPRTGGAQRRPRRSPPAHGGTGAGHAYLFASLERGWSRGPRRIVGTRDEGMSHLLGGIAGGEEVADPDDLAKFALQPRARVELVLVDLRVQRHPGAV